MLKINQKIFTPVTHQFTCEKEEDFLFRIFSSLKFETFHIKLPLNKVFETLHFTEIIISFSNIHSSFFAYIYNTWNYSKLTLASFHISQH